MKVTANPVDQHQVTLTIEVPATDVAKGINASCQRIASQVNIPGFRKGKANRQILEMNYGKETILEEAYNYLVNKYYDAALTEQNIIPVTEPEVEKVTFEEGQDLVFKATVTKRPEVTLGDYKGLEVEKPEAVVSDEQVQAQLERLREQKAEMVVAEEGTKIANGDFAVIDFAGFVDGKAFDGGEGKSYPLQIGSASFIPGFEEQLIGAQAGDDVEVNVNFPEDYFVADLAGKAAQFKVHVNDVKRKQLPELTDEFVKENSAYETVEAMTADLRKKLEEDAAHRAQDAYHGALVQKAVDNASVDIPEVMVEARIDQMLQEMAMNLEGRGMKFEDYLKYANKKVEDLRAEYKQTAAANVRADLVLETIVEKEGIKVANEDLNFEIYHMAQNFGADPKEVRDIIVKEGRVQMLVNSVARKKAAGLIISSAKGAKEEAEATE